MLRRRSRPNRNRVSRTRFRLTRLSRARALSVALSLSVLCAGGLHAQGIPIQIDGDFPPDLAPAVFGGWELLPAGVLVSADRAGDASSRALRASAPAGVHFEAAMQCIDVPRGNSISSIDVRLSAWMRVVGGQVDVGIYGFGIAGCGGLPDPIGGVDSFSNQWEQRSSRGSLPFQVESISIVVSVTGLPIQAATAFVDDVSVTVGNSTGSGIVANGAFDFVLPVEPLWSLHGNSVYGQMDSSGSFNSGAMGIAPYPGDFPPNHYSEIATQCVFLEQGFDPDVDYTLIADLRVFEGRGRVQVESFTTSNCTGQPRAVAEVVAEENRDWSRQVDSFRVEPSVQSVRVSAQAVNVNGAPTVFVDGIDIVESRCVPSAAALCLLDRGYRVSMSYVLPGQSEELAAQAVQLTDESGYFSFFSPDNIEASVKMVDGCAVNGRAWVYVGGMTDLRVRLRFVHLASGEEFEHEGPGGVVLPGLADVDALPSCPAPKG